MILSEMGKVIREAGFGGKNRSLFGFLEFETTVRHPGGHDK